MESKEVYVCDVGSCTCHHIEPYCSRKDIQSGCVAVLMDFDVLYLDGPKDSKSDFLRLINNVPVLE